MSVIDLAVTMSADAQASAMIRELTDRAARLCGHSPSDATAFGVRVASAIDGEYADAFAGQCLTCTLRQDVGPLEVVITSGGRSRTLRLDLPSTRSHAAPL